MSERLLSDIVRDFEAYSLELRGLADRIQRSASGMVPVLTEMGVVAAMSAAFLPVRRGSASYVLPNPFRFSDRAYPFTIVSAAPVDPIKVARPSAVFASVPSLEIVLDTDMPNPVFLPIVLEIDFGDVSGQRLVRRIACRLSVVQQR